MGLSKTHQSSLTLKGGSTSHLGLLPSGKKRKPLLLVALNRFAIWLADHQRSTPAAELRFFCAEMNPPCGRTCESELSLRSFAQPFPSGYRGRSNRTGLILFFKNLHKTFGK